MEKLKTFLPLNLMIFALYLWQPQEAHAMHIMEGFLPGNWAIAWGIISLLFIVFGLKKVGQISQMNINMKMLLGLCGAFAFVLSSLKIPSVTGSCSHPTGVGLGAILFGPTVAGVLALIVLLFQAILLAHGGLSTLGANVFSMGVAGPFAAYFIYRALDKSGASKSISVFCAAAMADLVTYVVTSIQLGLAFPAEVGGVTTSIVKFLSIFAFTQIPLAISEGLLTVVVFNMLMSYNKSELEELAIIGGKLS
jgi:cobalt/nickel transport system permease protein